MAERRLKNRRLSSRRSNNNVSGFLNENTNIIETNDPLWYDRSIVRPSTSFNLTRNETTVLNSDSTINASEYSDSWYKNLTQSDVSTVINNHHNTDKNNSSHVDPSTESESDSQRKRAKFGLNKKQLHKKNQSLKSNAFLQALEKTTDSKSHHLNAEELLDENQSVSTNDESRTIKKIRPVIFRRKQLLQSRDSNFDDVFEDDNLSENNNPSSSNSKVILQETSRHDNLLIETNSELQRSKSTKTLNESKISTRSTRSSNLGNVEQLKDFSKISPKSKSRITLNESNTSMSVPGSKVNEDNFKETQSTLNGIQKKRSIINFIESNISTRSARSAISKLEEAQTFSKNIEKSRSRLTQNKSNNSNGVIESVDNRSDLEKDINSATIIEKSKSTINLNKSNISNRTTVSLSNGMNLETAHDSPKSIQKSKSRINLNTSNTSNRTAKSVVHENNLDEVQHSLKSIQNSRAGMNLNKSNIPSRDSEAIVNGSNSEEVHDFGKNIHEHRSRRTLSKSSNISNRPDEPMMDANELPNKSISIVRDTNKLKFNTLMNPRVLIKSISIDKNVKSSLTNIEERNLHSSNDAIEHKNKRTKYSEEKINKTNGLMKSNAEKSNLNEQSKKSVETSSDGTVEHGDNDPLNIQKKMSTSRQDYALRKYESTPKVSSKMLVRPRMSNISDYFFQTPKPAQSTMNLNGRPLMNITQFSFSSASPASIATHNPHKETTKNNQENEEASGDEEVDVVYNSDENIDNNPEIQESAAQNVQNKLSNSRNQKVVNQIENTESIITSSVWENIRRKTDEIKAQTRARLNREAAIEKEIISKKLKSEANLRRILAKQEALRKKLARKPIDKAYLVNGKPYKQPKLPRPMSWASDRLYKHLWKCMESKFGIKTRIKSEQFMVMLADTVKFITSKKKYDNYKDELEELLVAMAKLNIIKTRYDFERFCSNFLPYNFRIKVVPMMLPGNIRNIPFHPELLFQPILKDKNESSVNRSYKQKKK